MKEEQEDNTAMSILKLVGAIIMIAIGMSLIF